MYYINNYIYNLIYIHIQYNISITYYRNFNIYAVGEKLGWVNARLIVYKLLL